MKSILILGLGRFGKNLTKYFSELGQEVMAVDTHEERVNEVMPYVVDAQIGDTTNPEFLESLGVNNYDLCFVTIADSFQSSLETTSLLKECGAKKVISRAERDIQKKFLLKNGADEVIYPLNQIAKWAATKYSSDYILDSFEIDEENSILRVQVPKSWIGKSIQALDVRRRYNINIAAVRENGKLNVVVSPDLVLTSDMTLLVLGDCKTLEKVFRS